MASREPVNVLTSSRPVAPVREITAILVSWNDAEDVLAAVRSLAEARCRTPAGGPHASLLVVCDEMTMTRRDRPEKPGQSERDFPQKGPARERVDRAAAGLGETDPEPTGIATTQVVREAGQVAGDHPGTSRSG